eukprot:31146-Chlamydomonas_euryale.AAC.6
MYGDGVPCPGVSAIWIRGLGAAAGKVGASGSGVGCGDGMPRLGMSAEGRRGASVGLAVTS